jgi:uncharacterized protein
MKREILTQAELMELLRAFKEQRGGDYHLRSLGYFGSYARNEANSQSDVDIVFETDVPNLFRTVRLREDLIDLLNRPVDVIRYREHMNPRLKAQIQKEAVYV